ncbi:MAG: hypothetical protein AVDCRST_MAG96-1506, partial [uncultured Segetibacter sp.]
AEEFPYALTAPHSWLFLLYLVKEMALCLQAIQIV